MNQRQSADLDRHITGNWGEDQFLIEDEPLTIEVVKATFTVAFDIQELRKLFRTNDLCEGEVFGYLEDHYPTLDNGAKLSGVRLYGMKGTYCNADYEIDNPDYLQSILPNKSE